MTDFTQTRLQSKTINFLRLPLIIGVILFHSKSSEVIINSINHISTVNYPLLENVKYFFSDVLGLIPSRMFFLIAGFLYFNNVEEWSLKKYKTKITNRIHSLLIPYLFWNAFILLIFFICQNTPGISNLFSGKNLPIKDYGFENFIGVFWNTGTGYPESYQFWFIRDLMVVGLLSPIFWYIVKYLRVFGVVILGLCWFFDIYHVIGLDNRAVFFFTCGAYFSLNKINIIEFCNKLFYISIILYPTLICADLFTRNLGFNIYIHNFGIIWGIVFLFNVISVGIKNDILHNSHFLSSASFFVFAAHEPLLIFLRKILTVINNPISELDFFILYFVPFLLTLFLTLSLFFLMTKYTPRILHLISGERA